MAKILHCFVSGQKCARNQLKLCFFQKNWQSNLCHAHEKVICHKLNRRGLIKASGKDTTNFLQGLLTNDMSCLDTKCDIVSLYSLLLNVQGRVLFDLILYKNYSPGETPCYLLECDREVITEVISTIQRYRIRKKVALDDVSDDIQAWAVCPDSIAETTHQLEMECSSENKQCIVNTQDPRIKTFGRRIILPTNVQADAVIENSECCYDESVYQTRRYIYGLGEGVVDMPPGNSLPLESNAEFLNGVSFNKGCYIGQELTARTHHTGVIRKRLMPIQLDKDDHECKPGDKVKNGKGKDCGKFRDSVGRHGLALLRVEEALTTDLHVEAENTQPLKTYIPQWWPRDTDEIIKKALASMHAVAGKQQSE